ncbi:MAG: prenyltransferase, partial [Bacteroidales bacterium]|nr:prenyltransferase [Bacteroidales bacterium]
TGILHANNTRDIENDTSANIATQASVLGVKMSRIYYLLLVGGAYVMVAVLAAVGVLSWIALAVVLSLPIAIGNIKRMAAHKQPTDISDLDGNTAKLVMIFSLLLSVANFITALVL